MSLEEDIEIAQNADGTANQISYMRPEFSITQRPVNIHRLQIRSKDKPRWYKQQNSSPYKSTGQQCQKENSNDKYMSKRKSYYYYGAIPSHPRSQCPAKDVDCFICGKKGHFSKMYQAKKTAASAKELEVEPVKETISFQDCLLNDYKPMLFHGNIHSLITAAIESLNQTALKPHIRSLWLSKLLTSQIYCIDCENDTGADCNVFPLSKGKELFGNSLKPEPPTVKLRGYNNVPGKKFGSCFLFLCHGENAYNVRCEVA